MPYNRPNLPYISGDLPNNTRFTDITNSSPDNAVAAQIFDIDMNSAFDSINNLEIVVNGIGAGILPGADNPLNVNKLPTTDGNAEPTISFIFINDNNIQPGGISGISIAANSITTNNLQNGCISNSKVVDQAINQQKLGLLSVGTPQLQLLSVNDPIIANMNGSKILGGTITQVQMGPLSVGTPQLIAGSTTIAQLATAVLNLFIPIGTIIEFAGTTVPPANFLECNGQLVSTVTYAALFAVLGTRYGSGGGTFGIPDRRGRVAVGIGSDNNTGGRITAATAPSIILGGAFGTETYTLTIAQMPSHTHNYPQQLYITPVTGAGGTVAVTTLVNPTLLNPLTNTGGGGAHPNVSPSIFMRYYIRAL